MLRVRDIMTRDIVVVAPDATLREVAEVLAERRVSGAPVVEDGRVVGVISATDLMRFESPLPGAASRRMRGDRGGAEAAPEPPPGYFAELWAEPGAEVLERFLEARSMEADPLDRHTAGEIMTRDLVSLPPDADVHVAAERMLREGVHRLLVIEDGRLEGVVSATDVLRAVAERRL
ncbi:MAG TPA: CBS domain-containing protein [Longimicrobiales bacterium]